MPEDNHMDNERINAVQNEDEAYVSLKHIDKIYENNVQAVFDFNLDIKKHEFIVFVGPSGCGTSTTLRMVAGFEIPTSGEILLNGKDITNLPHHKRPINTVFQRYALFPHLDVYDNIAFGLKLKKLRRQTKNVKQKTEKKNESNLRNEDVKHHFVKWKIGL